uniref:Zinc finger protein with KRAB and SCAN domains 1-like n=1 Tax=Labrus bergylta TaxID=56723 RepID=A0A3Q3EW73_9LABR|nr:zinc finger protein with KRAB and SCAN domains 1-like [Labrus bergylta]
MSGRLAFQTQLASIMEVLANAAVAEICKLVDDDYAVVSLQMSQCQRENKALKRKLHLLELKMARGNAERRLRESAMNGGRPRVQITGGDRLREAANTSRSSCTDAGFGGQMDVVLWSERAAQEDAELIHTERVQRKSPDVELVEEDAAQVKEEKVEAIMSRVTEREEEEEVLIRDDGVLERVPCGPGQRPGLHQQDTQSSSNQTLSPSPGSRRRRTGSRGVEVSDSSSLLSCELVGSLQETINRSYSDSQFDVLCDSSKNANLLVEEFFDERSRAGAEGRMPSCSYSMAAADFPSSSSGLNGQTRFSLPERVPVTQRSRVNHRTGAKERLFVCSYCGKAFNRPKKVEIHQRVHTGEKPFSCSTCGKTFSEAGNLRKHQRVHSGEKPYSCGLCGRGFAWIRNLKTHQLKSHPEVYSERTPGGAPELSSFI